MLSQQWVCLAPLFPRASTILTACDVRLATSLTQTFNPRRVYIDTKRTIQMSCSRFKPIQPYTPATKPLISDQRGKPPVQDHLIRRLSAACKECQRRRTKVRILDHIVYLAAYLLVFNDSAVLRIHAWNARSVALFAFSI